MTDAHCHVTGKGESVRELLVGRDFFGVHPWETLEDPEGLPERFSSLILELSSRPQAGVGEIGLDRLKVRKIPPAMREVFERQLKVAFELGRPVVLHGAKCWGQVVETVRRTLEATGLPHPPALLFHGFSRSDGLIPDIVALGGYISVGPAVLNDHAVNYRELVKKIPLERLLVETDRTPENAATCPSVRDVAAKVAELRGLSADELETLVDRNAAAFFPPSRSGA